eukprot:2050330-Prymnesium_polylepis.1
MHARKGAARGAARATVGAVAVSVLCVGSQAHGAPPLSMRKVSMTSAPLPSVAIQMHAAAPRAS